VQPDVGGWYGSHQRGEDLPQRTARLRAALAAMRAEVHDVTHANWAEVLLKLATAKGLRQVLVGTDTPHGAELLPARPTALNCWPTASPLTPGATCCLTASTPA
jgi:L-lactate utilization protein LutC